MKTTPYIWLLNAILYEVILVDIYKLMFLQIHAYYYFDKIIRIKWRKVSQYNFFCFFIHWQTGISNTIEYHLTMVQIFSNR